MPKRVYKRKRGKRSYRRRRRGGRVTTMTRTRGVLPDMMQVRMTYVQKGTLTSAVAVYLATLFRGNSLFDPDFSGVGGQPLGRDEWSNFYTRYRVYASKCHVSFDSEDSADGSVCMVVPCLENTSFLASDTAMETPYARYKTLGISAGINRVNVSNYMESSKLFGVKAINYDVDYSSTMDNNPPQQWYWHVAVATTDGSSFPNVNYTAKITYYVELFGRKQLFAS